MQTTPNLGMVIPSSDNDVFDEMAFVNALLKVDAALGRTVRGRVSSSGGIVSGTGFTVTKNGTGSYTVTFTTAFSAPPLVICSLTDLSNMGFINGGGAATITAASFNVTAAGLGGAAQDEGFTFRAEGPA